MATGSRSGPYTERLFDQRTADDADQAEFSAMISGSAVFESGIYDDRVADSMDDFDPEPELSGLEGWQRTDLETEEAAGRILQNITRRQELLGDHYPFRMQGNSLFYVPSETKVYEFCLAVCNVTTGLSKEPFNRLPQAFEHISRSVIELYLGGTDSRSYHTGWPRQGGASPRFKGLMSSLAEQTLEWAWQPDNHLPDDPNPAHTKDEGLDFVAWRPFADRRQGNLFLLGQCACGNDWSTKFGDIEPDFKRLRKWFNPMTMVEPVRVFCTPYYVTDAMLIDASQRAGLVFDRVRLTLLAENEAGSADRLEANVAQDLDDLIQLVKDSAAA
ncbi:MAG: hypothetical protein JJU06_13285 [Ectothiorhodospiraceae bacterium]|nr:hypothetical protein [Ectothiorhodospiraceae bacterium]